MNTQKILSVIVALLLVFGMSRIAWAVYAKAEGNVITFRDDSGNPLKDATLTGLFNGEEITGTTDSEGRMVICRKGEEGDKRRCGLILPGDGKGKFGTIDFTYEGGVADVSGWDGLSKWGKAGVIGGATLGVAGGVVLLDDDDSDDDDQAAGGAPVTDPGTPGQDPGQGDQQQQVNATANVNCNAIFNPQNSFQFLAPEIIGNWSITFNPATNALAITLPNGVQMTGTKQGDQANVSGSGNFTGVNTTATFNGTLNLDAGILNGVLEVGPPLGGGPADEVDNQCNGAISGP